MAVTTPTIQSEQAGRADDNRSIPWQMRCRQARTRLWLWLSVLLPPYAERGDTSRTLSTRLRSSMTSYKYLLMRSGAVRFAASGSPRFVLRSGKTSSVYIDHAALLCEPEANQALVSCLADYVGKNFDGGHTVLANVDSKSSPHLTGAVAAVGGYRQIVVIPEAVRRVENGLRLSLRVPQGLDARDTIVIVDDVLTAGDRAALDVVDQIRRELASDRRARCDRHDFHLVVAVIRDAHRATRDLEKAGVKVHWLTSLEDMLPDLLAAADSDVGCALRDEFPDELGSMKTTSRA